MDSNEYNSIIFDLLKSRKINSNYAKTVGRQLGVFNSEKRIKEYIESKVKRIYEDYEYSEPIKWSLSKDRKTKINRKQEIQFPKLYINENQIHFLTDIPYGIALYYHSIVKKQDLVDVSFIEWLDFFTSVFFNVRIIEEEQQLEKLADTLFPKDIYENYYFKTKKDVGVEKNIDNISFISFNYEPYHILYFKFKQRHLLFRKKQKKA